MTTTSVLHDDRLAHLRDERVLTLGELAEIANVSITTIRRVCRGGDGPTVTQLSPRRLGVRVGHAREWLDRRAIRGAA